MGAHVRDSREVLDKVIGGRSTEGMKDLREILERHHVFPRGVGDRLSNFEADIVDLIRAREALVRKQCVTVLETMARGACSRRPLVVPEQKA